MTKLTQKESLSIRYVQGICIVAVVLSHYPIRPLDVFWPFIFHMPMFFLLGGLLYKRKSIIKTCKDVAIKHLFYLTYTYVIISLIATFLSSRYGINVGRIYPENFIYSFNWAIEKNFHNNAFFLVAWFLFAYAFVTLLCRVILIIPSKLILFAIAIVIGYIGMNYIAPLYKETKIQHFNLLSQIFVGSMFYILGFVFKKHLLSVRSIYIPLVAVAVLFTLKSQKLLLGMGMSWSDYHPEFYLHMLSTVLSIVSIFVITNILSDLNIRYDFLSDVGKYSKEIMSYHLLSFFTVDWIFYKFGMYDISKAQALSHFNTPLYWYCYGIAGVLLPIISFSLIRHFKMQFLSNRESNA